MFGIGGWELLVIVAAALLVLGPRRLPSAARAIGKGLQSLRRATVDLRRSIELDPEMEDLPQTLDEINRPLVGPATLLGATPRRSAKPDQDFGDVPPPAAPRKEGDSSADDGASAAGAGEEGALERPPTGPEAKGAAREIEAEDTGGDEEPAEPAEEVVERTTTRRAPGGKGADEPATDGDGRGEEGS